MKVGAYTVELSTVIRTVGDKIVRYKDGEWRSLGELEWV
jgi:hypothetical protein